MKMHVKYHPLFKTDISDKCLNKIRTEVHVLFFKNTEHNPVTLTSVLKSSTKTTYSLAVSLISVLSFTKNSKVSTGADDPRPRALLKSVDENKDRLKLPEFIRPQKKTFRLYNTRLQHPFSVIITKYYSKKKLYLLQI